MTWTCDQVEERLSEYLDELLPAAERSEFATHVESCARCAALVSQVSQLVAGMQRLEAVEPPALLAERILDCTLGPRAAKRAWYRWFEPVWQPRFALGALTVLATFSILLHAAGVQAQRPFLAALNPVNLYRNVDRRAHLIYARGAKFVNDLRLVYEIQSRLQPETPPDSEPRPATSPEQSRPQKKSSGQVNRGIPARLDPMLASAIFAPLPERSLR